MAIARITSNTIKEYPCTMCGSSGNIVREGDNPRLKCTNQRCGFMYDASDSLELVKKGEVPTELPEIKEETHVESVPSKSNIDNDRSNPNINRNSSVSIPRVPSHIIIAKDRKTHEFTTEKDFKRKILQWEASGKNYDVFQLTKVEYSVKVE